MTIEPNRPALHQRITVLRRHLYRRAGTKGVGHPCTLWTSRQLDRLIVEWQKGG